MKFNLFEINTICISLYAFKKSLSKEDKSYKAITKLYDKVKTFVQENQEQIKINVSFEKDKERNQL